MLGAAGAAHAAEAEVCSRLGWGGGWRVLGAAWRSALSLVAKRMASTESSAFSSEKSAHCHTQERSEPAFSLSPMLGSRVKLAQIFIVFSRRIRHRICRPSQRPQGEHKPAARAAAGAAAAGAARHLSGLVVLKELEVARTPLLPHLDLLLPRVRLPSKQLRTPAHPEAVA
tara:strand:- start:377 stop:889 length:513 start_codon:yes stop_codon:yes gene_type:complete